MKAVVKTTDVVEKVYEKLLEITLLGVRTPRCDPDVGPGTSQRFAVSYGSERLDVLPTNKQS